MALSRSENMARIKARNTSPELLLRKHLWASGLRYRTDFRTPGGRADVAAPGRRLAVFVDGCFWHGCPEHYVRPRSAKEFWDAKLRENIDRDTRQTKRLLEEGWTAVRLWEHELVEAPEMAAQKVMRALKERASTWPSWRVERVEFLDAEGSRERRYLTELLGAGARQEEATRQTAKKGRVLRLEVSGEKVGHD